jgi:DNA-binding response OmpR family regulator
MQILVIDDDDDIREVLSLALTEAGYQVLTAIDGEDALERLQSGAAPSVLLVDLMLPRLDGEGLIRSVQADRSFAAMSIILISGHRCARDKARELGVFCCLVKPIELEELLMTVAAAAARATANAAQEPSPTLH